MAFGGGKFQCPGRSVAITEQHRGSKCGRETQGTLTMTSFIVNLQGNPGGRSLLVWSVLAWDVSVGRSVVTSHSRSHRKTLCLLVQHSGASVVHARAL